MSDPNITVDLNLMLAQVSAQRNKALTDLAAAQAACQQMAARIRELEADDSSDDRKVADGTA